MENGTYREVQAEVVNVCIVNAARLDAEYQLMILEDLLHRVTKKQIKPLDMNKLKELKEAFDAFYKKQMEAAQVPPTELQPYVMEIANQSEADRALAAARKLGYPIDETSQGVITWGKYEPDRPYFVAWCREEGSAFHAHKGDKTVRFITLEDFEKLAGITYDPLEGKKVEGFSGGKNIGLNYGEQHLWYCQGNGRWGIACTACIPTPYHLTRVTERTVGRFYLVLGLNGTHAGHFGLYLGDKYVRWSILNERYPIFINPDLEDLTMYEVTPTV